MTQTKHVYALFKDYDAAAQAVEQLKDAGFTPDTISVLMTEDTRIKYNLVEPSKAPEGAIAGGAIGTLIGGIAAIASLGIPGGIIVAGPFVAFLGGAGAGLVGGGLVGALIGAGIPEEEARRYEAELKDGAILVGASTADNDSASVAEGILSTAGPAQTARPVEVRSIQHAPSPA